nr:hypothetical protein IXTSGTPV_IXTSGTPV_CDS_0004 [Microvirus sp.]
MVSIYKLRSIVVYDDKNKFYASIPVYPTMTVKQINSVISVLIDSLPLGFSLTLE